jgi:(2S)-methylsuccinyl-CoA dehydrogenase
VRVVAPGGALDAVLLDREQRAAHGLSWLATYVTALRETLLWAKRLRAAGRLGEIESLICQAAFGEYLAQIRGGIAMSQGEIVRPADLGARPPPRTRA